MDLNRKRPKILIVDDTAIARSFIRKILAEDYDLIEASHGEQALEAIATQPPDVILLDLMMPGMDGIEVCRRIKGDAKTIHIPVIMMTTLNRSEERARSIDAGADDFLPKPFEGVELVARLRSMLRIKRQFDELDAAMKQRESLGQMIVHDLRGPLTGMMLALDALEQTSVSPEGQTYVRQVNEHLRRVNGFLTELLAVAKMDAGHMTLNLAPVPVADLLDDVVKSHQLLAKSKGTAIQVEVSTDFNQWPLDSLIFHRVIDNLLSNAIKFSPPGEPIRILLSYPETETPGGAVRCLRIEVADSGAGVPEEHRDRLFGRFQTFGGASGQHSRPVHQIGLGLAFCKMAIEAHGGRIRYEANKPKGAVFIAEVPPGLSYSFKNAPSS